MARVKPLKRLGKKIGNPFTWLKPGENESRFAAPYLLAFLFLLTVSCLLLTETASPLTVGLLPRAFSQNQPPATQPQPSPTPSPTPTPSPSPTPPPNLHQWGALTSFHGLPSDRTNAVAQTEFGVTWFATDGGLARFDGRRT